MAGYSYPTSDTPYIPSTTSVDESLIVDPMKMDPDTADMIFGKPVMDVLRESAKKPFKSNRYVKIPR